MQEYVAALLTKHGKQEQLLPVFEDIGWRLIHTDAFDTDSLGTFGGEVERQLKPLDCAVKKAQIAAQLTGAPYGIGSEGSFFPSPYGFGTVNLEIIACVDNGGALVAAGAHEAPFAAYTVTLSSIRDPQLNGYLEQLPDNQATMVLSNKVAIAKGLANRKSIEECLRNLSSSQWNQGIELSYDLRAHYCPDRRQHIRLAAQNLCAKLQSHCPQCDRLGFWPETTVSGLPCEWCHQPTNLVKMRIAACRQCSFEQKMPVEAQFASPQYCEFCNP
ncbi:DUF6671 family protein [Aestuariibacter salexigens]|uniref:DUF6671 family protein n=1 Tax=Aestuariibacter salexigens TaxID=226010 RepID=UPI00041C2BFE|nr:DUF6671 family protein [Aestuariibacter salexigens]